MRRRVPALAALALAASGCGTAASHPTSSSPATGAATHTAVSCAFTSEQAVRRARTVFIAIALAGPTGPSGTAAGLVSPAAMQVLRYLRGHGPQIVRVTTAIGAGGLISEDGIVAHQGERWRIATDSPRSPLATSLCAGSRRLPALVMRARPGAPS